MEKMSCKVLLHSVFLFLGLGKKPVKNQLRDMKIHEQGLTLVRTF